MSNDAFSDDSLFDDDSVAPESDFSEDFTDESMSDAAMDSMDDCKCCGARTALAKTWPKR